MNNETRHDDSGERLHRSLSLTQVTASGVGIVVGAGIYVLVGAATEEAGAGVWMSFLLAAVLSALTALSYAELAAMYPNAGAEYDYTRRVAPEWVAFVVGWVMICGLVVAAAAVSLGFASYVRHFVDVPVRAPAWGLLGVVVILAVAGIERSTRVTVALSAIQVGGLVAIVAIGAPSIGDHDLLDVTSPGGVVGGAALVFFAFIGFDEVITLAQETTDPVRTVPRALLLALAVSTVLYVAVAVVAVSVLGADQLASSDQPLADVMATAIGGPAADVLAMTAILATTNTTLLAVTAASRLQYGMGQTRALPGAVTRLNRHGAPWFAVSITAVTAAAFVGLGDLTLVASVTDFAVYVVFIAVNVTVVLLRFWQPRRRRPFRVPGAIGRVPIVPVLGLAATCVMLPSLEPRAIGIGGGLVVAAVVTYLVIRRTTARPTAPTLLPDDPMTPRTSVTPEEAAEVADILRVDFAAVDFDLDQFCAGMRTELQHGTGDPDTNITNDDLIMTGKIALAHLNEIPDYYTRLAAMEDEARRHPGP